MNKEDVLKGYIEAALWSSYDDNYDNLDSNYSTSDIDKKTLAAMKADVDKFLSDNADAIKKSGLSAEQLGHDFWLTRNHHGAGFFDRGLDDDVEKQLMDYSDKVKGIDLYVGDDGKIYSMQTYNKGGSLYKTGGLTGKRNDILKWLNEVVSLKNF